MTTSRIWSTLLGEGGATFSDNRVYRYLLWRVLDHHPAARKIAWLMLNPSTADEQQDDPTIRRCLGFSEAWGFGHVTIVNIFALRSTDPDALYHHMDPIGPENDAQIIKTVGEVEQVVCAWGRNGRLRQRGASVRRLLHGIDATAKAVCLGTTKEGHPKHPLYLAGVTARQPLP